MRSLPRKWVSIFPRIIIIALLFSIFISIDKAQRAVAANTPPVQVFFLPMPEDMVLASFRKIATTNPPAAPMRSVTGISITANDTAIYYDQWENGYEPDLANPINLWTGSNLGGTQIWGDHIAANGCPPNRDGRTALSCTDGNDVLNAGDVIVLENNIPLPRTSAILFDARDKVGATKVIAVTRSVWAQTPGTVLADAIEVYDTTRWGTNYEIPIGQNTSASNMFSYTSLIVSAAANNTTVQIDTNGDGSVDITRLMNQGDVYQVDGGISSGATVTATDLIQVDLLTGKVGSTYASRWFEIPPNSQWTDSLWTAVGTTVANYPANVFIFNPGASPLTVNYETRLGSGNFSVPANTAYRYEMPLLSGAHFYTGGNPFLAIGTMDSSVNGTNQTYDWGYTLVPDAWLTPAFVAGWAPGTADYSANGSPVWVTATNPTTIYVDYGAPSPLAPNIAPNGARYDVSYSIGQYESRQIFGDPAQRSQTGMKVFTIDGTSITGAWGEDPSRAQAGTPYLDVGYTIPPLPVVVLSKEASLAVDLNSNGEVDPGDTLLYTVQVRNNGAVTAFNTVVTDTIPTHTNYVPNSTTLNSLPIPDNSSPSTSFPLDETGYSVDTILVGGTATFTYRMTIDLFPPVFSIVSNTVQAVTSEETLTFTLDTPINSAATQCVMHYANSGGGTVSVYQQGDLIYVTLNDGDTQGAGSVQTTVINPATSDRETLTLAETGPSTGLFINTTGLPFSATAGQTPEDSTLYAQPGDTIQAAYTDPVYSDTCSTTASLVVPSQTKQLYLSDPSQALDRVDPVASGDGTTAASVVLGDSVSSTIAIDGAATSGQANQTSTITFSHTTGSGTNRLLLVGVSLECAGATCPATADPTVSTVTFNGVALTRAGRVFANLNDAQVEIWRLFNPPASTTANVVVTLGGTTTTQDWVAGAITLSGVDQAQSLTPVFATGNGTTATVNITSTAGQWVFDTVSWDNAESTNNPGTNQTMRWNRTFGSGTGNTIITGAASTKSAAGTSSSWTGNASSNWAIGALVINPATVAGVTTATFTQAPSMATPFSMPSGGAISVTTYVNVATGSMPANPNITATLRYGATTFATLSSPTYNSGAGTLIWSGSLASNTTIPASAAVILDITTAQSGVSFTIQYDSTTRPSRIDLPTTTVITVDTLEIFDAPYPGGSLVPNPTNGQTVYIRTTVSDPFGAYDIHSATLSILDPSSGVTNITLDDSAMVASTASSKTYEYAWMAPAAQGIYTLTVTGNEGLEGLITHSRSLPVTIINQDMGTPSTVEFTAGLNGPATTSYDSTLPGTNQVCIRLTDFDQNQDPATAETITVDVDSSKNDPETVTLTETGVDTGIFTTCMTRETSAGADNDQIYALAGDLLTVSYIDPNDPTDSSSASAVMTTTTLTLTVSKLLVEPADGIAPVGATVRFDFTIANPNTGELNTVAVTDTFPNACLSYVSASITPDSVTASTLTWNDIGPLAGHASQTISVYFTAIAACSPATNQVDSHAIDTATSAPVPAVGTVNATADVTITRPQLSITKTLTSASPASLGSNATFHIVLTNTGTTIINTLPLTDTYSAFCMEFASSTPATTGGGGSILWSNLGPLGVGSSVSVDVTFTVQGSCNPAQNTATVNSATDINGDPLPVVQTNATVVTEVLPPTIAKSFAPDPITINGTSTLTFLLTNPNSSGSLSGLAFTDTYPTGLVNNTPLATTNTCGGILTATAGGVGISLTNGTLAAGGSCTVTIQVTSSSAGIYNNVSEAVTSANSADGNTASDSLSVIRVADLSITKTDGTPVYTPGISTMYEIVVSNAGPNNVTGATVTDNFPAAISASWTCIAAGGATCTASGSGNISDLVNIPVGGTATYTILAGIDPGATGNLVNTATVAVPSGTTDPTPGNNSATDTDTATPAADLVITKTDGVITYTPGGTITYTIVVTNSGPSDATGATVTDTFPAEITSHTWTCVATGGAACTASGSGDISDTVNIPAYSGMLTYTVVAGISAGASGNLVNTATVASPSGTVDPTPGNNSATDTDTAAPVANLAITKTDGVPTYTSGGTVTYTIGVTNVGPSNVTGATVSDNLPAQISSWTWTCLASGGASCTTSGSGDINDTVNIPVGDTLTYTVVASISIGASGAMTNTAAITAPGGTTDPIGGNNSATDTDAFLNLLPTAVDDSASTSEDTAVNISVLANDSLGDTPTFITTASNPPNGSAAVNDNGTPGNPADDFIVYTPDPNWFGIDSFTHTITDNNGDSSTATVTVTVASVDDLPNAVNDTPSDIAEDNGLTNISILGNDTFGGDGPSATAITIVTGPGAAGTASVNVGTTPNDPTDDTIDFTPAANYTGPVSFTYRICDLDGDCDDATVSFNVTSVDDFPNAVNDTPADIAEDSGLTNISVLGNDSFGGDGPSATAITIVTGPGAAGTATVNTGGTLNDPTDDSINFTPAANYTGPVSITYRICDLDGDCDDATVSFNVTSVDDFPNAVNDTPVDVAEDSGLTNIAVLVNDTFGGDGPSIGAISMVTGPGAAGTASVNVGTTPNDPTDDTIDFTPAANYTGPVSFTYRICDLDGDCDDATVSFNVTSVDDFPNAVNDTPSDILEDSGLVNISILSNDTFGGDGPSIGPITIVTGPGAAGTATVNDGGTPNDPTNDTIDFTPASSYSGPVSFTYRICDLDGDCDDASVDFNVIASPGSISGVVFNDINANGAQDPGETGIDGVTVTLYDNSGGFLGTQTTSSGGSYSFTGLTAGVYQAVESDPIGYVSTTNNTVSATVVAGANTVVNFGDQLISGGVPASVSGTVYDDVNGNGIRDAGESALPNVTVELLDSGGSVVDSALTASDGSYSFTGITPGIYTVRETDPGGYISTTPNQVGLTLGDGSLAIVDFGDQTSTGALIADPAVTKFGDPASAQVGDIVTFIITVSNPGSLAADNVVVTDTKPDFLDVLSVSITPGSGFPTGIAGNTITIDFGTLAPGAVYTVQVVTRVNSLGAPPGGVNNVSVVSDSTTNRTGNDLSSAAVSISVPIAILPGTGFAAGRISVVPVQPLSKRYVKLGDLSLYIPKLGIRIPIVGVPRSGAGWDLTWLWNQAGWLNGTAFPTWSGNSVVTAHVYLPNGKPGPFINLYDLAWGDTIIVSLDGQEYIYQVRERRLVGPDDLSILRHEELPWLTLVTCRSYHEATDSYRWREVVRAVQVEVK